MGLSFNIRLCTVVAVPKEIHKNGECSVVVNFVLLLSQSFLFPFLPPA